MPGQSTGPGRVAQHALAILGTLALVGPVVLIGPVVGAPPAVAAPAGAGQPQSESLRLPGGPMSATDATPVDLEATVWLPGQTPAAAVILAHGFGGSKDAVADQAQALASSGFVVLAYSARGFGTSTGLISVNAPDFEVADARALIDYLGTRSDVVQDGPGDPRVGIVGGSYGGALALLAAGYDPRVDAVAADITWNDLEAALFGQSISSEASGPAPTLGAYKQQWSSWFFSVGLIDPDVTTCGRFSPQWCAAYLDVAVSGQVSDSAAALMRASSPISVTDRITAPTLISGGEADSLFPLAQADANARQIMAAHPDVPVKVVWHGGGHDGGIDESERIHALTADWLGAFLTGQGSTGDRAVPDTSFEVTLASGSLSTDNSRPAPVTLSAATYPGLGGTSHVPVNLAAPSGLPEVQRVRAPAGGSPAALSSLPGLGAALPQALSLPLPGQSATFESAPLDKSITTIGASTARLRLSAPMRVDDVVLFASLRIVSPGGRETVPDGLVAPMRLQTLGPQPVEVDVQLPAIVADLNAGDRLRLVVTTTDQAYRLPLRPAIYQVGLASAIIQLPLVDTEPIASGPSAAWWPIGALAILGLLAGILAWRRPRPRRPLVRPELAEVPLAITDLTKAFPGGLRAVDGVSFTVPKGVVLGLLGPNGAGKTTTMRMAMGLIRPTAGDIFIFGQRSYPGSPVLSRIGALVEGAGFLPHLTGRANLDLYWRASGRMHQPSYLDEVLEIADLGTAIDRKVRTYSQGMRQRLGIAQAMLGKPDLLVLDEPTNGLDPPQIRAMRQMLQRYAVDGRTVIVSSHLLSEVEQTCTDVVVMHRGRLVAAGSVADLLAGRANQRLEDVFLEIVGEDLTVGR